MQKTECLKGVQHGGQHYKGLAIEPVEYCHANGLGFLEGSAIKYLTRYRQKNGPEDLKKAMHYIQMILEMEYGIQSNLSFLAKDSPDVSSENSQGLSQPGSAATYDGRVDISEVHSL